MSMPRRLNKINMKSPSVSWFTYIHSKHHNPGHILHLLFHVSHGTLSDYNKCQSEIKEVLIFFNNKTQTDTHLIAKPIHLKIDLPQVQGWEQLIISHFSVFLTLMDSFMYVYIHLNFCLGANISNFFLSHSLPLSSCSYVFYSKPSFFSFIPLLIISIASK